jgi:hypothetical protein
VGLDVVDYHHHLLAEPDIFIGVNGFDAALTAGRHKEEVLRCRRADERDFGLLVGATVRRGLLSALGFVLLAL